MNQPDAHATPARHPGHSVLQVPVPPLEEWVRERTAFYDTDYVSTDPAFTHAHVTALGPFVDALDAETETTVAAIAARWSRSTTHWNASPPSPPGSSTWSPSPPTASTG
ncbi:hypothetical protein [Nocardioides daphniae]|uniref:hypothetical protein n=1 Tax=Nocardioides daphniae TaxID=402297 RepID=UPI001930F2A9|nr:hypothetical protein [Nocardioides daphniae]